MTLVSDKWPKKGSHKITISIHLSLSTLAQLFIVYIWEFVNFSWLSFIHKWISILSMSLLQSTSLPNPISTFSRLLNLLLPATSNYIQWTLSILSDVKLFQFSWARGDQPFLPIFLQNETQHGLGLLKIYRGIDDMKWPCALLLLGSKKFLAKATSKSYQNKTGTLPIRAQSERAKDIGTPLLVSDYVG